MNVSNENEFSNGKLEDSLIKKISTARVDLNDYDQSKNEDGEPLNRSQIRGRENEGDFSNIEDIANKISMYT